MDIQDGDFVYSGLLRDGGSAVIILQLGDKKIKLRVMRSIAERAGELFNKIEILIDDSEKSIVSSGSDLDGLNSFIAKNKDRLDARVLEAFSATFPNQQMG
jgi:hypothetical protein